MMPEDETHRLFHFLFIGFLLLITGEIVYGDTLETDVQVLLSLKDFLETANTINRGIYMQWKPEERSVCDWQGISCDASRTRVVGIDLSYNMIAGNMFGNFSALTALTDLDLSKNSISGIPWADLSQSQSLKNLNLSYNTIEGTTD